MNRLPGILYVGASVVVGLVACGRGKAAAPEATMRFEEISQAALARIELIESIHVEYDEIWKALVDPVPEGLGVAAPPQRFVFRSLGQRRFLSQFFIAPKGPDLFNPRLIVFDGERSADLRFNQYEGKEPVMMSAFLLQEKVRQVDEHELYCREVLGLLLTDDERSRAAESDRFPHCLGNYAQELKGTSYEPGVLPEQEAVDGAWCHVVEFPGDRKLWVDTELGCALRKLETYTIGAEEPHTYMLAESKDFFEAQPGLWVPRDYVRRVSAYIPGQPHEFHLQLNIKLREISINCVTEDDFKVAIPAGVDIVDCETGTMEFLAKPVDDVINDLAAASRHRAQEGGASVGRLVAVILSLIVLLALAAAAVMRKRARLAPQ